jgi:hypothetical protein
MALSARNHLKGEITEVLLGTVTALITPKVGDNIESETRADRFFTWASGSIAAHRITFSASAIRSASTA